MSARDALEQLNRVVRLASDRSLTEVVTGLTLFFLWIALIAFVLWLTVGSESALAAWRYKTIILISMLLGSVSALGAGCLWSLDRNGITHRKSDRNGW